MGNLLIAGAGIGGLTCGIALHRVGRAATIYEQAETLRAAGAGLILQTNAMLVMEELGLGDAVRDIGAELGGSYVMTSSGKLIQELDLRTVMQDAPFGVAVHRQELLPLLADAFDGEIEFGARVSRFDASRSGLVLELEDGSSRTGMGLIACDGLYSRVRQTMRGEEPLRYAGYTTWRGITHDVGFEPRLAEIWGGALRFGIVPLPGDRVYWFAVAAAPARGEDGDHVAAELRERFAGWPAPVEDLLHATPDEAILRTDVFDRTPIDHWTDGRVALLGDAAHPMTPNLGQGAGQAIEDALAMANAFDAHEDVPAAFERYASARRQRANWFVQQSWRLGQLAQLENPILRGVRDLSLRLTPTWMTRRSVHAMYTPVTMPAGRGMVQ